MFNIIYKEIKSTYNLKFVLLIPILVLICTFVFAFSFKDYMVEKRILDKIDIGLVDEESSSYSNLLINSFKSNKNFTSLYSLESGNNKELMNAFDNEKLDGVVVVPEGFTNSLLRYENNPLNITLNPKNPLKNLIFIKTMESYSTYVKSVDAATYSLYENIKGSVDRETLNDINNAYSIEMIGLAMGRNRYFELEPISTFPSSTSIEYFSIAFLIVFIGFISLSGSSNILSELENHTIFRYMVSGRSTIAYLLTKSISQGIFLMVVIGLIAIPLSFVVDVNPFIITISLVIVSLPFNSFASMIALLIKDRSLNTLISSFIIFILSIIGGAFIPIQLMPSILQEISIYTPFYVIIKSFILYISSNDFQAMNIMLISCIGIFITISFINKRLIDSIEVKW